MNNKKSLSELEAEAAKAAFINFMAEMVMKYGGEILKELQDEEASKTDLSIIHEDHS